MKKTYLFLGALALLGFASCSDEEVANINDNLTAISFRPSMGTRAEETTNANLTEFNAISFLGDDVYFDTIPFRKDGSGFFVSNPEYNFPGDNSQLNFYAYAPATINGKFTFASDKKTLEGFSPAAEGKNQVDFITANATGTNTANGASGVPLTFQHRLAQIVVLAKTDNTAYTYKVSGVRVGQPVSQGDFDFTTEAWTLGTQKSDYSEEFTANPVTLGSTAQSVMGDAGSFMLLPQALTAWNPESDASNTAGGAYLSILLNINTKAGAQVYPFPSNGDCKWAAIPISTNWEAGKKYIYTLDLTNGAGNVDPKDPDPGKPVLGGPIKFSVTVTDWTDTPVNTPMTPGIK